MKFGPTPLRARRTQRPNTMPTRPHRVHDRASAGFSRTPRARTLAAVAIFYVNIGFANAADSGWLPAKLKEAGKTGFDTACANDYKLGGARIVQCAAGTPTTTQIAANTHAKRSNQDNGDGMYELPAPKAWITIQDHSVSLVPSNTANPTKRWTSPGAAFGSTNWGGNVGDFLAQGHMTWYGDKQGDENQGSSAVRSGLEYGFISYAAKDTFANATGGIGENQFLVGGGGGASYYLNGCPNYVPGQTSANTNYECPRVKVSPGSYKFSMLGLLFGSMINSDESSSYGSYSPASSHQIDLADYKSLVLTQTLDISNVGADNTTRSATVEFANGTTASFTDITETTDLAGAKLYFESPGSGENRLSMSLPLYYTTGRYSRSISDMTAEFGAIPCSGGMDVCQRDLTGFKDSPDSFPMGANIGVKKMGKGGLSAYPKIDCGNGKGYPTSEFDSACDVATPYGGAIQSPKSTKEELAGMAGAPKLEVTEVHRVKIYLRKSGCIGRPTSPAATDASGTAGTTWPNAPADCPAWYLASNDGTSWRSQSGHPNNIQINNEWLIDCEAGDLRCYLIDFHFDLEYQNGTRTVLGSPENDAGASNYGWSKGTFFMYDPEISESAAAAVAAAASESVSTGIIAGAVVAGVVAMAMAIGLERYVRNRRTKKPEASTAAV